MSGYFPQPPPLPMPFTATVNGGATSIPQPVDNTAIINDNPPPSPSPSSSSSSSFIIVIIVIASAIIVSATIYLILRLLSRRFHRSFRTYAAADDVVSHSAAATAVNGNRCLENQRSTEDEKLLDSLPLFKFGSVTGNLTGVDCAVCLSKFEPDDQLRLLPLCCHAFHSSCIDAWLVTNQTCPLCRSTVYPTDEDVLSKVVLASENNELQRNGSFRIEIGSISRRRGGGSDSVSNQRSYSVGSFDYIVDDGYEVSVNSIHRRGVSESTDKESSIGVAVPAPPGESIASDISGGGGRSWLRDYVDRIGSFSLSSRSTSFRSSGRFFNASSRRSDTVVPIDDLEAGRIGEEISELFRWLSGV
ncbi:E3 ubiquitin-protein ligase ATL4 [Lycium barbarum]|uniref:E3 ubiquitin-protein ligase ATL4 n=1 Tax=Lycium barbarum TaxID=112863 RepID=UPI00293F4AE9|nr:E3 ubiquitin-protein ligase ATL4 [Lycium barbarum]